MVFSINAITGDVLNFQLPCDCEVAVTEGIFEGATVLPIDVILSFFGSSASVRAQTLMSIEGLAQGNEQRAGLSECQRWPETSGPDRANLKHQYGDGAGRFVRSGADPDRARCADAGWATCFRAT